MPIPRHHAVGRFQLLYRFNDEPAVCSVGLVDGANPYDAVQMADFGLSMSAVVGPVMPSVVTIYGWRSLDPDLLEALTAPLADPVVGSHGTIPFTGAYESRTATLTGATKEPTAGNRLQQTLIRLRVGNTIDLTAGEKTFSADTDSAWADLRDYLNDTTFLWSDIQGRKALCRDPVQVQMNAYYQNRQGT